MGIRPYKTFTFDGVSSANYGVYLTGEGVFNAPERDVEQIEIPGRNGNFALDQGRFKNISVTYKAGMYGTDESTFATKISNFRNWLCSKKGYCRLEDDYNSGEYRMAVYSKGLDVDPKQLISGEFEITFECKPQRWLTSGETATAVANNGTLSNPTLFDASPLLEVKGYGDISIGGNNVSIANIPIGDITFVDQTTTLPVPLDTINMNNGDYIDIGGLISTFQIKVIFPYGQIWDYNDALLYDSKSFCHTVNSGYSRGNNYAYANFQTSFDNYSVQAGTISTKTNTVTGHVVFYKSSPTPTKNATIDISISQSITYNGSNQIIVSSQTGTTTTSESDFTDVLFIDMSQKVGSIIGHSTISAIGNPMYIDLDIGECWNEDSGVPVSVNDAVNLGSDLPVLPSGTTTFTYDNTITELKVTPRWWKV